MKLPAFVAALALVAALPAAAQTMGSTSPIIVMPTDLKWTAAPGMPDGTKMAVVYGDPTKTGAYVMRLSLPDGTKLMPHFHDGAEFVTVLQGSILVGIGSKWDATTMKELGAGSYAYIPAKLPHYAQAKGDLILQLDGMGPFTQTDVK